MIVEFARNRIAKIRNDLYYSKENINENILNNNKDNNDTSEILNWYGLR